MRMSPRFAVVLAAALVSGGCGFTLRQAVPLPAALGTVAIAGDSASPLVIAIENDLTSAGARLGSGGSTLKIVSEQNERNIITLDDRAKVGEYELHYRVVYTVLAADGTTLIPDTPIALSRIYSFDEQQAIGAAQEEDTIRAELRRDAVRLIMEGLQRL